MIIHYDKNTGEIIHAAPEADNPKNVFKIQVIENGVPKYKAGDIRTLRIPPKQASAYQDPRKPEMSIHKHRIRIRKVAGKDVEEIVRNNEPA